MQPPGGKRHAVLVSHSRVEIFGFHHPATERRTRAEHIAGAFIMVLPRSLCSMTLCLRVCVGERTCFFCVCFYPSNITFWGWWGTRFLMANEGTKSKSQKETYIHEAKKKPNPRGVAKHLICCFISFIKRQICCWESIRNWWCVCVRACGSSRMH